MVGWRSESRVAAEEVAPSEAGDARIHQNTQARVSSIDRKHSEEKKRGESPIPKETLFDNLGDKALKFKNRSKSIVANRKFSDKLPPTTKPSRNQEASNNVKMKDPAHSPSLEDNSSEASGQSESSNPDDKKCLPSNVRSPFNMTSNIESEAMCQQYEDRARGKEDVS